MPSRSRKKTKGKVRRAAKEAKAVEEGNKEEKEEALEVQMRRLTIDDLLRDQQNDRDHDAALRAEIEKNKEEIESIKLQIMNNGGFQKCHHLPEFEFEVEGESKSSMLSLCRDFKNEFTIAYNESVEAGEMNIAKCLKAGVTATEEKFAAVWNHAELVGFVVSCYASEAVQYVLDGNDRIAGYSACIAYFLEESIASCIEKTQPAVKWLQVLEVCAADLHTLVEFLRKRIPCQCLDEKYSEVKSIPRMGICNNPECSLPDSKAERSKMFYCGRCRFVCYCSTECQKEDWSWHKKECKKLSKLKAEFAAKQATAAATETK